MLVSTAYTCRLSSLPVPTFNTKTLPTFCVVTSSGIGGRGRGGVAGGGSETVVSRFLKSLLRKLSRLFAQSRMRMH